MAPSTSGFLDVLAGLARAPSSSSSSSSSPSSTATVETATRVAFVAGGLAVLWATRVYALHYVDSAISLAQVRERRKREEEAEREKERTRKRNRSTWRRRRRRCRRRPPPPPSTPPPKRPPLSKKLTTGQPRPPQAKPVSQRKLRPNRRRAFREGPPGLPRRLAGIRRQGEQQQKRQQRLPRRSSQGARRSLCSNRPQPGTPRALLWGLPLV